MEGQGQGADRVNDLNRYFARLFLTTAGCIALGFGIVYLLVVVGVAR